MIFKSIIGALAVAVAMSGAATADTYEVGNNYSEGGRAAKYIAIVEEQNAAGNQIAIRTSICQSACTFFLLADDVCVAPRTLFKFHGPSATWTAAASIILLVPWPTDGLSDEKHAEAVEAWRDAYNARWPGLGDWFVERASHRFGWGTVDVRGRALHDALGIPLCGDDE